MIIIGSDHSGSDFKNEIIEYLCERKLEYMDVIKVNGPEDDYPDIAVKICKEVKKDSTNIGIAICGTGIGISIACNKINGIRAALCTDEYMSKYARVHNNSNVLCLGARLEMSKFFDKVKYILDSFIDNFYEGGRHDRRIKLIKEIENNNVKVGS